MRRRLLRAARRQRSAASTTASTARPTRTAWSPPTPSATACCSPTTSPSTTSARTVARRSAADGVTGTAAPLDGVEALFGGPATVDNPVDEAGAFTPTSDVLPVERVPAVRELGGRGVHEPVRAVHPDRGRRGRAAPTHVDDSYKRLGAHVRPHRLIAADDAPTFEAQIVLRHRGRLRPRHRRGPHRRRGRLDDAARPQRRRRRPHVPAECEAGFFSRSTRSSSTT